MSAVTFVVVNTAASSVEATISTCESFTICNHSVIVVFVAADDDEYDDDDDD